MRHYLEFEAFCQQSGNWFIEHRGIKLSFLDLQNALESLSPRKKEAIYYNVILDYKQKDVAAIMGITTVSVGQYVEQGASQIARKYFSEDEGDGGNVREVHDPKPRPDVGAAAVEVVERLSDGETQEAIGVVDGLLEV